MLSGQGGVSSLTLALFCLVQSFSNIRQLGLQRLHFVAKSLGVRTSVLLGALARHFGLPAFSWFVLFGTFTWLFFSRLFTARVVPGLVCLSPLGLFGWGAAQGRICDTSQLSRRSAKVALKVSPGFTGL